MIEAVIFDMDGVLVDTEPLDDIHTRQFIGTLIGTEPVHIKTNYKGMNAKTTWPLLMQEFGITYELDDLIIKARQSYIDFLSALTEIPLIPGVDYALELINQEGHRIALASSANPKRVELILASTALQTAFEVIVHGDDIEHSKPAPDIYLLAAKRLGIAPERCVAVEDSTNGVTSAKAAGMACIGYTGSDHNTEDLSAADVTITDFKHFQKALADI